MCTFWLLKVVNDYDLHVLSMSVIREVRGHSSVT